MLIDYDEKKRPDRYAPLWGAFVGFDVALVMVLRFQWEWPFLVVSMVMGLVGGSVLWMMERIEHGGMCEKAANPYVTWFVLLSGLALCWVPLVGWSLLTYGLYRSRRFNVSDGWMFPFALFWLISLVFSVVMLIVYATNR
jgi:hypothetical protein